MALKDICNNKEHVYGIIYMSSREAEMQLGQGRVRKPLPKKAKAKKSEKPWQTTVGLGKQQEG